MTKFENTKIKRDPKSLMKENNNEPGKKIQFFKQLVFLLPSSKTKIKYFRVNNLYKKVISQV